MTKPQKEGLVPVCESKNYSYSKQQVSVTMWKTLKFQDIPTFLSELSLTTFTKNEEKSLKGV